jgi:hypothetical protein
MTRDLRPGGLPLALMFLSLAVGLLAQAPATPPVSPASATPQAPPPPQASGQRDTRVAPSTREMAALLQTRAAAITPAQLWFNINAERAEMFAEQARAAKTPLDQIRLRMSEANELLYAGRYAAALDAVGNLLSDVDRHGADLDADAYLNLLMLQATTWMRMGEEQNCADNHNADSCLLPIKGGGVHMKREGSTRALETLDRILRIDPDNLRARWLVNIAHMTLGSYPDGVPPRLLIPPSAFASSYAMKPFTNVASEVGLDIYGLSGGAVLEDFDNDGRLDLMTSSIGFKDQIRLFHNDGDGHFTDVTATSGLEGETGGLNMIHADFDNDGLPDVLVLRGGWMGAVGMFPVSLLKNMGHMRFVDVTKSAGLLVHAAPTQTATWLDYDGDGWLDLFIGNESSVGDLHPCELFHNNHDGTFTNVAKEVGVDLLGYVKAVVSADYDNDGRPDLYLSIAQARNVLFHNDGRQPDGHWRFSNVSAKAGVEEPTKSFPAMFFDYDNDGWVDLFVAPFLMNAEDVAADYLGLPTNAERPRLYHNEHNGTFRDVTREMGLYKVFPAMGLNFGDLDNDGWLDFYVGTGNPEYSTLVPKRMFRNDGGRRFIDVTTAGNFGHLQKGHAIAFGDIDNDGDQDIFEEMGGAYQSDRAYSVLYENPGNRNHWISLSLEGTRANRSAIGARVKVIAQTASGPRAIYRTVGTGASFGSQTLRVHVGLGRATAVTSVEVRWPGSNTIQLFRGFKMGEHYRLREGTPAPIVEPLPRFTLSHEPPSAHTHTAKTTS